MIKIRVNDISVTVDQIFEDKGTVTIISGNSLDIDYTRENQLDCTFGHGKVRVISHNVKVRRGKDWGVNIATHSYELGVVKWQYNINAPVIICNDTRVVE